MLNKVSVLLLILGNDRLCSEEGEVDMDIVRRSDIKCFL